MLAQMRELEPKHFCKIERLRNAYLRDARLTARSQSEKFSFRSLNILAIASLGWLGIQTTAALVMVFWNQLFKTA